jgi:hypothetical protein
VPADRHSPSRRQSARIVGAAGRDGFERDRKAKALNRRDLDAAFVFGARVVRDVPFPLLEEDRE